mgnify:CR=1 FL=1
MKKVFLLLVIISFLFILQFVSANEIIYNYSGLEYPSSIHNASTGYHSAFPLTDMSPTFKKEFNDSTLVIPGSNYTQVELADNTDASAAANVSNNYALHLFEFIINESSASITGINISWRGYGYAVDNLLVEHYGAHLFIWNSTTSTWDFINSHVTGPNTDINMSFNSSEYTLGDYLDGSNHLYILAQTNETSTFQQIPTVFSFLYTDYVEVLVDYNAVTNPPVMTAPTIIPEIAYENDTLNCSTTITDSEGDTINVEFYWYNDTTEYTSINYTALASGTIASAVMIDTSPAKLEIWNCTVQIDDGTTYGNNKSIIINISDAAPALNETIPTTDSTIAEADNQTFEINTTDIDDDLVYFTWYIDSVWNKSDGILNYSELNFTSGYRDAGTYNVSVNLSDSVNEVWWNWTLTITDNAFCVNNVCEGTENCITCPEDCGGCSGWGSGSVTRASIPEEKVEKKEAKEVKEEKKAEKKEEMVAPFSSPLEELSEEERREDSFFNEIGLDREEKILLSSIPGYLILEKYEKKDVKIEDVLKPYRIETTFTSLTESTDTSESTGKSISNMESEKSVLIGMVVYADVGAGDEFRAKPRLDFYFGDSQTMPFWCSNNKKDYDEKGVDCGGSCQECGVIGGFCGDNICSGNERNYCIKDCKKRNIDYYNVLPISLIFLLYLYFKSSEYERKHFHHEHKR